MNQMSSNKFLGPDLLIPMSTSQSRKPSFDRPSQSGRASRLNRKPSVGDDTMSPILKKGTDQPRSSSIIPASFGIIPRTCRRMLLILVCATSLVLLGRLSMYSIEDGSISAYFLMGSPKNSSRSVASMPAPTIPRGEESGTKSELPKSDQNDVSSYKPDPTNIKFYFPTQIPGSNDRFTPPSADILYSDIKLPSLKTKVFPNISSFGRPETEVLDVLRKDLDVKYLLRTEYEFSDRVAQAMTTIVEQYPYLNYARANAVILVLCRNEELKNMVKSMDAFEKSFNSRYHYPYVFLNDLPFTQDFQNSVRKAAPNSNITFHMVPLEHWSVPGDIDPIAYDRKLIEMGMSAGIPYGGSRSYRLMCRFFSRFFYKHPALSQYKYYWRLEPNVDYKCMIRYDVLLYMTVYQKKYGYNIVAQEVMPTVSGLWKHTTNFMKQNNITMTRFMREAFYDPQTDDFNGNHFWSNFEIGDLDMFRSKEYEAYMDYLDRTKGFFMERYGDAPIHSLYAGMKLRPRDLHYFGDISYKHDVVYTCPLDYEPENIAPLPILFSKGTSQAFPDGQVFENAKYLCVCTRLSPHWVDSDYSQSWGWRKNFISFQSVLNAYWND